MQSNPSANQVLRWIKNLRDELKAEGKDISKESITEFAWKTLNSGQAAPRPTPNLNVWPGMMRQPSFLWGLTLPLLV